MVVVENPTLERLERGSGIDAEMLDERGARLLKHLECLCLAPGAVEGEHQLPAWALAQRLLADELPELGYQLAMAAERKVRLEALLERDEP